MQLTEFLMTAEAWTIIGTGIAILVAIAASNHSMRAEIKELRTHVYRLEERINEVEARLAESINQLGVRLGRVEGTLDVVRDSMFGRHDVA